MEHLILFISLLDQIEEKVSSDIFTGLIRGGNWQKRYDTRYVFAVSI